MTEAQVQPGHPYPELTDAAARMNLGQQLVAEFVGADIDEIRCVPKKSPERVLG